MPRSQCTNSEDKKTSSTTTADTSNNNSPTNDKFTNNNSKECHTYDQKTGEKKKISMMPISPKKNCSSDREKDSSDKTTTHLPTL